MNNSYVALCGQLPQTPKEWLVNSVAAFISNNQLETLLALDQEVVGLDNLATGYQQGEFRIAEAMAEDVLSLPIGPHLSFEDQDRVIAALLDFTP